MILTCLDMYHQMDVGAAPDVLHNYQIVIVNIKLTFQSKSQNLLRNWSHFRLCIYFTNIYTYIDI